MQYGALLDLGVAMSTSRFVAAHGDDRRVCGEYVAIAFVVVGVLTCGLSLAAVAGAAPLAHALGGISTGTMRIVLVSSVALFSMSQLSTTMWTYAVGRRRMVPANVVNVIMYTINFVASVGSIALGAHLVGYVLANVGASVVALVVDVIFLLRYEGLPPFTRPRRGRLGDLLRYSAKAQLVPAADLVNYQTDKIVIAFAIGPAAAGAYELANRAAVAVRVIGIWVTTGVPVQLTAELAERGIASVRQRYARLTAITSAVGLAPVIFAVATGPLLLAVWLHHVPRYSEAVLIALCAAYVPAATTGVSFAVAVATARPGIVARTSVGAAIANVILTVALAPPFGIWGVLAGTAAAIIGGQIAQVIVVHRTFALSAASYLEAVLPPLRIYALLAVPIAAVSWTVAFPGRLVGGIVLVGFATAYFVACGAWAARAGRLPQAVLDRLPSGRRNAAPAAPPDAEVIGDRRRVAVRARARLATPALVLSAAAVAALVRISSWGVPINRDAAQMLYGGQTVLDGLMPYHDAAVNKGPVTYVLFAVLRLFVGRSETALRIALLVFAVVAAVGLARYLMRLVDVRTGIAAGLILALFSGVAGLEGSDPNLEQFALAPMALALWAAVADAPAAPALSGALTAFVALMSPALAIPLAPVVALLLLARTPRGRRFGAALLAGAVLVAIAALWLIAGHALGDFFTQVPGTENAATPHLSLHYLLDIDDKGLFVVGVLAALIALVRRELRLAAVAALAWIALSWIRVKAGDAISHDTQYAHHYYPALLGICAAIALAIRAARDAGRVPQAALAAVLILPIAAVYVARPEQRALKVPAAARGPNGVPWADAYPLARYLDSHTRSDETVFVSDSQPEILWLADRRAPSRIFDEYSLTASRGYRGERLATLRRHPPAAFVALARDRLDPEIAALVARLGYREVLDSPAGRIWMRGSSAAAG